MEFQILKTLFRQKVVTVRGVTTTLFAVTTVTTCHKRHNCHKGVNVWG